MTATAAHAGWPRTPGDLRTPGDRAPGGQRSAAGSATARRARTASLKVTGQFAYGSDLWPDDMIWGVTLRSPHPYARIKSIDIGPALATPASTPC